MYGIGLLLNLINVVSGNGGWFGVILSALVIGLLFKGSNIVRIIVMVLAVLGLVFGLFGIIGMAAVLAFGFADALIPLLSILWGMAVDIFALFTLTRPEVKEYFTGPAPHPRG